MTEIEFKRRASFANRIFTIVLDPDCEVEVKKGCIVLKSDKIWCLSLIDDRVDIPALASEFHLSL